jgi:hypothetical protein
MAEDKKKSWFAKHKILTVILALIVVGVIASVADGGSKSSSTSSNNDSSSKSSSSSKAAEIAKIGTPVRDGKFEFTVSSLQCGVMSVGDNPYLTKTPQGQFCLLIVSVKNIGNEKQSLLSSNQKLLNGEVQYSADDTATLYAAPNGSSWYNDINPGNSVEGKIVFDVPKDITPTVAELHDSAYSGGVKINVQ